MLMNRYILAGFCHLVGTGLVLKILLFILPCKITSCFFCASELLITVIVSQITFSFTKKHFLNEEIKNLEKKVVLITGCDHGFGNELAKRMRRKGFHVFACCLDDSEGAKELQEEFHDKLKVLKMDVTKDDDIENASKEVQKYMEDNNLKLWAVVNNAGIFNGYTVEFTKLKDFEDDMNVNAFGMVRVTKKFLPLLRKSRGRVVNVTSLAGRVPMGHIAPYTMSKFAAVAFTECLRHEMLVWGIKVISIEPEFFKTPMSDETTVSKAIDLRLESTDEETKKIYGKKYIKALKEYLMSGSAIASSKIYKVIDALEKSICLKYPDTVYKPSGSIVNNAVICVWKNTPSMIQDIIFDVYQKVKLLVPSVQYPEYEN